MSHIFFKNTLPATRDNSGLSVSCPGNALLGDINASHLAASFMYIVKRFTPGRQADTEMQAFEFDQEV